MPFCRRPLALQRWCGGRSFPTVLFHRGDQWVRRWQRIEIGFVFQWRGIPSLSFFRRAYEDCACGRLRDAPPSAQLGVRLAMVFCAVRLADGGRHTLVQWTV